MFPRPQTTYVTANPFTQRDSSTGRHSTNLRPMWDLHAKSGSARSRRCAPRGQCIPVIVYSSCEAGSGDNATHAASQNKKKGKLPFPSSCKHLNLRLYYLTSTVDILKKRTYNRCLANNHLERPLEPYEAQCVARGLASRLRLKLIHRHLS